MTQMVQKEFSQIDGRLIIVLAIYFAINVIACTYFNLGLDACFAPQVSSIPAYILFGSILLGPPATFLSVIVINFVCIYADYAGPNSAVSCLLIVGSLIVSFIDMVACPSLFAGV
jgi:hypothetical protein